MFQSHKHTILSAIMAVFLTGTLVITATVISNPNISLDIRNFAAGDNWMNEPTLTVNSVKTTINPTNGTAHSTVSYSQGGVTNTINTNATVNSTTGNRQAGTTVTNAQGNVVVNRNTTDTMNNNRQLTTTHTVDTRTNANGTTNTFDTTVNVDPTSGHRTETTTQNGVTITQNGQYVSGYNPNDPSTQPSPNPSCGSGYKLNTSTHQCDPNMTPDQIDTLTSNCNADPAKHYDQETGQCVGIAIPTSTPRTICGTGYTYNSSTNKCDPTMAPDRIDQLASNCNTNSFTHYDPETGKCVSLNTPLTPVRTPSPTPNSLNPNVAYKIQCQPGYQPSTDNLHCVQTLATPTNAAGCTLKCGTGQYCKASGAGRTGAVYSCVAAPTPVVTGTLATGTDCNSGSQCGSGRCGRAPHVSGAEAANAGHKGNFCQPSDAEIAHAVTVELAVVGGALATTVGATELAGAAGTIWTLAGGSLASLPAATLAYGSAGLATPALTYGGAALTLGGTAVATQQCVQSHDPNSPACAGLIAGYRLDPAGFTQALSDSSNTLIAKPANYLIKTASNSLRPAVNQTIDSAFQSAWGSKLNQVVSSDFPETIPIENFQQMQQAGTIPDNWTIRPSNNPNYVAINVRDEYDPYQQLLTSAQHSVNAGNSPEEAVATLMKNKLGLITNKTTLPESLNFNLNNQGSLAGKVWCGTANCVQQSMVSKQLLTDLGVSDAQTIYGLGGAFPFIHAVTNTPEGVIMFGGGQVLPPETFLRYTNMVQVFGNYQLP